MYWSITCLWWSMYPNQRQAHRIGILEKQINSVLWRSPSCLYKIRHWISHSIPWHKWSRGDNLPIDKGTKIVCTASCCVGADAVGSTLIYTHLDSRAKEQHLSGRPMDRQAGPQLQGLVAPDLIHYLLLNLHKTELAERVRLQGYITCIAKGLWWYY